MTEAASSRTVQWTVDDLETFPEDDLRREIVDGELFVSRAAHPDHQDVVQNLYDPVRNWNRDTRRGRLYTNIGIVFDPTNGVIPDLLWASHERWAKIVGPDGRLVGPPELVVEVLSPGFANERRDREAKLKLYSTWGVDEYWIVDRRTESVDLYRRESGGLVHTANLRAGDTLTSPLLPGLTIPVANLFARPQA